jgi:hypothetical protein
VLLLALAERRRMVADTLAAHISDGVIPRSSPTRSLMRVRMLAIGCDYPDGNDFDWLRCDRPGVQAGVRTPSWHRPVLAADHLALGECADTSEIIRPNYTLVDHLVRELPEPSGVRAVATGNRRP